MCGCVWCLYVLNMVSICFSWFLYEFALSLWFCCVLLYGCNMIVLLLYCVCMIVYGVWMILYRFYMILYDCVLFVYEFLNGFCIVLCMVFILRFVLCCKVSVRVCCFCMIVYGAFIFVWFCIVAVWCCMVYKWLCMSLYGFCMILYGVCMIVYDLVRFLYDLRMVSVWFVYGFSMILNSFFT